MRGRLPPCAWRSPLEHWNEAICSPEERELAHNRLLILWLKLLERQPTATRVGFDVYYEDKTSMEIGEFEWDSPTRNILSEMSEIISSVRNNLYLDKVPFDQLMIGDFLIGHNGMVGRITSIDPGSQWSGGELYTGWLTILWGNGNESWAPQDDGCHVIYLGQPNQSNK